MNEPQNMASDFHDFEIAISPFMDACMLIGVKMYSLPSGKLVWTWRDKLMAGEFEDQRSLLEAVTVGLVYFLRDAPEVKDRLAFFVASRIDFEERIATAKTAAAFPSYSHTMAIMKGQKPNDETIPPPQA